MKQRKSKVLSVLAAAAVFVSSVVMTAGASDETAEKIRYAVPDYDFAAEGEFLGNSNDKKPTWASWRSDDDSQRATRDDASCMYGKSAKITDNSAVSTLFVDLYDDYALPAGDYILQAFAKTEEIVTDNDGATDQGLRLYAINWTADDTTVGTNEIYSSNLTGTTDGWAIMELPFTVDEGVSTVRIGAKMNNSKGTAYVTRFTIRPADDYYTVKNGGFEDFTDFATEFVRDAGPAYAVDGEKWGAWTNYDFASGERTWDTLVTLADVGHESSHSLCIDLDVTTAVVNIKHGSLVKLEPGKDYEVSVWVKTENVVRANPDGSDQGAYLHLTFYNKQNDSIIWPEPQSQWVTPNALAGTNDWTKLTFRFTAPEEYSRVQILPSMTASSGKAYFDDIEIKEAEPLPADPIVEYPDFEGVESFIRNDTPAGAAGDAIRYNWGAWYGKSTDGSAVEQPFTEAFTISDTAPAGFTKSAKIDAKAGTNYQIRQIIENLDGQMEYVLRAQVKTEGLTGEGATVGVAFLKEDKSVVWELNGAEVVSKAANGDTDWTDLFVKFTMPADTTDLFLYGAVRDSEGTAYFTNFELLPAVFYDDGSSDDNDNDNTGGDDNTQGGNDDTQGGNDGDDVPKEDNKDTSETTFPVAIAMLLVGSAGLLLVMKKKNAR